MPGTEWVRTGAEGIVRGSVSGRQGPRLGFGSLSPTAVQAGEHGDHETGGHIHRSLQQHGALAFVTDTHSLHTTTQRWGKLSA